MSCVPPIDLSRSQFQNLCLDTVTIEVALLFKLLFWSRLSIFIVFFYDENKAEYLIPTELSIVFLSLKLFQLVIIPKQIGHSVKINIWV